MNIYVGNLPFSATQIEVHDLFKPYGAVHFVNIVTDPETGRAKGFGFVEMDTQESQAAIEALNGTEMGGRSLKVNEAKPRSQKRNR